MGVTRPAGRGLLPRAFFFSASGLRRSPSRLISRFLSPEVLVARPSEPIFNIPPVIVWLCAAMALIHGVRAFLDEANDLSVLLWFAFIPARYDPAADTVAAVSGGIAADIWTFVTYSFLHAEILHIAVNLVWLLAFGSAVAWRFGAVRFLLFFAATAAAGAGAFLFTHFGELIPLVGASGAISGAMAAACRFVFAEDGPLGVFRGRDRAAYLVPAVPLREALRNRRVVTFSGFGSCSIYFSGQRFFGEFHQCDGRLGGASRRFFRGSLAVSAFRSGARLTSSAPLAPRGGEEDD